MGLLTSQGEPLSWKETQLCAEHVRQHGIKQFINMYIQNKDRQDNCFKWGDEIEYMIVKVDEKEQKCRVCLKADHLLSITDRWEQEQGLERNCLWRPDTASYIIEGTPGQPYTQRDDEPKFSHFLHVESNMRYRRNEMEQLMNNKNEQLLTLTSFPMLGTSDFCYPSHPIDPLTSRMGSIFVPDQVMIAGHPRFITTSINVRARRQRKVAINIPLFKDENTPKPFIEQFVRNHPETPESSLPDHVYMDSMAFGMGSCCLQVTFQAQTLSEACLLYDQMAPLCPLMMALSAACPIQRGMLTKRDSRWSMISQSMDDRSKQESGECPIRKCRVACNQNDFQTNAQQGYQSVAQQVAHNPIRTCTNCIDTSHCRMNKSRCDSIDSYISSQGEAYNDIPITYNVDYYTEMVTAGINPPIALHIAHLFIRDPTVVYREKLNQNDEQECDHFENIQSTNWQTMRFKPPPPGTDIGWRVEFRSMDIQLTDFENAAYAICVILLSRVILENRLNLLIPISKVDENMKKAQKLDAIHLAKFWFRKEIKSSDHEEGECKKKMDESCVQMSLDEIFNGKGDIHFDGLIPLTRQYLAKQKLDPQIDCCLQRYLDLIANRASGKCWTAAKWIRNFVHNHADYRKDSMIDQQINFDLLQSISRMVKGEEFIPGIVGQEKLTT